MGKMNVFALGVALGLTVSSVASAQGVQQWKTPSGATYIGSNPPPGSTFVSSHSLSQQTRSSEKPAYEAPKYEVGPLSFHGSHITGRLRNLTDELFQEVIIEFNLYNHRGGLIGATRTSVKYLEAGGYWYFDARTNEEDASSVKLIHVTIK